MEGGWIFRGKTSGFPLALQRSKERAMRCSNKFKNFLTGMHFHERFGKMEAFYVMALGNINLWAGSGGEEESNVYIKTS